jgi:adenine/guanine phosphoribosyltransferase-like PRPP-binding protein
MSATITTVLEAINLATALYAKAQEISAVVAKAQSEGRETLTPDEWSPLLSADDAAIKGLNDAIAAAAAKTTDG